MRLSLLVLLVLLSAAAVRAEEPSAQAEAAANQEPPALPAGPPDFLFGRPHGWLGVRAGGIYARAGSDWYDFVSDQLTVSPRDFNAPALAIDAGATLASRVDLVFGAAFIGTTVGSEYRQFVDNDRLPINQTTRLRTVGLHSSLKFALREPGREVGRLAWVPRRVVPYVGAGGGALWYQVEQTGDFVDFLDLSVFSASFRSQGWTPSVHAFGGVDVRVLRRVRVTLDGRYHWAAGDLGSTWVDFDPIDLSGFALTAGVNLVF